MTKFPRIKSPLFPIGILVIVGIISLACSDMGFEDEYTPSFLPPEITHDEKFNEFFCTPDPLYVSCRKDGYISDFNSVNVDEWEGYFQKQVKDKDLEYILYKSRSGEIDTLIFGIKKSSFPIGDELKGNSILKVKDIRSALDFLYYVGFAKRCEKYVTYQNDYWGDDTIKDPRKDKIGMTNLIAGGLKQMSNPKSDFVKQRYAFQVLRLYFIERDFDKCIQFYTKQKDLLESNANSIKYRAMGYAAGAYYGEKKFADANYLYSLIYANSDIMRISAYFSFHPQEEEDWNQTLAMAKTPNEKAMLWQMLGIYKDPFRSLKEVYAIDPKSELLDMLLARAVHKEEEHFITRSDVSGMDYVPDSSSGVGSMSVNKDLLQFVKTVANKENTAKTYEWNMAAGYLDFASGDKDFHTYLDKAKTESQGDTLVMEEVRLINLLDKINNGKAGDFQFEQSLVPDLIWLELTQHPEHFPREFAREYILGALSKKYEAIHDDVKSECFACANHKTVSLDNNVLEDIEKFMDKKAKTIFDQYALNVLPYNKNDIVEIQAVNLLYEYKFKEAQAKLNEADSAGYEPPYGDPFMVNIKDCHDCDSYGYGISDAGDETDANLPIVNNKRDFIEAMIKLEGKLKTDPTHKAHTYFLLANGYYNMSYFGNNRGFYDSKATYMNYAGFEYKFYSNDTINEPWPFYMDCSKAMEYYLKAMNASNSIEFKAKCCFMAAKCEQNYFFTHRPKDYKGDFRAGKFFAALKANYSNTEYYKEIIKECGYFRTYLGNK